MKMEAILFSQFVLDFIEKIKNYSKITSKNAIIIFMTGDISYKVNIALIERHDASMSFDQHILRCIPA